MTSVFRKNNRSSITCCARAVFFAAAVTVTAVLACAEGLSDRDKQMQIDYLFKMGTEYYYQGKYSQAIKYWEAVLDIDLQQTQPPALIENAREQIRKETTPAFEAVQKAVKEGDFINAQENNLKLLDLDPANDQYKDMMHKLKKVSDIFLSLPKNKKVSRLILQGAYAYVIEPVDVDLAFSSLRMARQIAPANKEVSSFYRVLKKEYPTASRKHVDIAGVNILDQILQSALNHIYAGEYIEAITACRRALKLDQKNVLAMKRLGSAYFALGNKKEAKSIWHKALAIDPGDTDLKKFLKGR